MLLSGESIENFSCANFTFADSVNDDFTDLLKRFFSYSVQNSYTKEIVIF